jgi:hypothetical protein
MEHTHDEYSDMFLTHGVCNGQLVLLQGNTCYVILVDVIQTLMCFDDWSSVSVRQEMYKHVAHGSTSTSQ